MKISVIMPSRGLTFAEAEQALSDNLYDFNHRIFRSWNLPIPECDNYLVEKALQDPDITHILFVEDDVVMPGGSLKKMLLALNDIGTEIACIDYGVNGYSCVTKDRSTGEILWCGLGSTLVKREVFDRLQVPYFRSDIQLLLNNYPEERWIPSPRNAYGGQDIYFFTQARKAGFKIVQVEGEAKHLKLIELGKPEINKGCHAIGQKDPIRNYQVLPL